MKMCMKITDGGIADMSFVNDDHFFGDHEDGSKHWEMMTFSLGKAENGEYNYEHERG